MALTPKQEKFCIEYVKTGNKSQAYRLSYNAENMSSESINVNASKLSDNTKVTLRIKELKEKINNMGLYSIEESINRDLKLLKKYENAVSILEDKDAKKEDVEVACRTLKFISISGYNSAQDRLSKTLGFYEKDNKQKNGNELVVKEIDLTEIARRLKK